MLVGIFAKNCKYNPIIVITFWLLLPKEVMAQKISKNAFRPTSSSSWRTKVACTLSAASTSFWMTLRPSSSRVFLVCLLMESRYVTVMQIYWLVIFWCWILISWHNRLESRVRNFFGQNKWRKNCKNQSRSTLFYGSDPHSNYVDSAQRIAW